MLHCTVQYRMQILPSSYSTLLHCTLLYSPLLPYLTPYTVTYYRRKCTALYRTVPSCAWTSASTPHTRWWVYLKEISAAVSSSSWAEERAIRYHHIPHNLYVRTCVKEKKWESKREWVTEIDSRLEGSERERESETKNMHSIYKSQRTYN